MVPCRARLHRPAPAARAGPEDAASLASAVIVALEPASQDGSCQSLDRSRCYNLRSLDREISLALVNNNLKSFIGRSR